ncbi:insulin-like growth factor 2 mRNA-binding protein 2 isoform X2 [Oppia nitens]|uniref:insulin-like growth factor 2 mRNA-binding protein 2 isoform X2 n=1 Tax=Oppia nitens TaxID=1686743 RepID=UPI0023DC3DE8|nr:insulin-like growth factor 2 mRNA-binding protein 2 isoform X2 [Oppia nitens]
MLSTTGCLDGESSQVKTTRQDISALTNTTTTERTANNVNDSEDDHHQHHHNNHQNNINSNSNSTNTTTTGAEDAAELLDSSSTTATDYRDNDDDDDNNSEDRKKTDNLDGITTTNNNNTIAVASDTDKTAKDSHHSSQMGPSDRRGDAGGNKSGGGGGYQSGGRNHHRNSSYRSSNISGTGGSMSSGQRPPDFPLRILVLSDMVGAIIGRSGGTIRQITQQTHARVDVHRKENAGALEKVITIYGNPDNCSEACHKILEVMQTEANNTNRGEIPLKILAHNNLIGRIIGKSGATIKRIMEQSDTKITVSSIHDVNSLNLERIIAIKGSLENMCKAETLISQRLRQSYESDIKALEPTQALMFPGLHPMSLMSTLGGGGGGAQNYPLAGPPGGASGGRDGGHRGGGGHGGGGPGASPSGASGGAHPYFLYNPPQAYSVPQLMSSAGGGIGHPAGPGGHLQPSASLTAGFPGLTFAGAGIDQTKETVFLYIPNSSVGAIIGTGGASIKEMISNSGASIKVAQSTRDESSSSAASTQQQPQDSRHQQQQQDERKVTIVGSPESQYVAQFLIYRKVFVESFHPSASTGSQSTQDPRLKVEIMIPSTQVGRIIGKGGSVVKEMQRNTRTIIKLPEDTSSSAASSAASGDGGPVTPDETPVHIFGDFYSTQAAQRQIRSLVSRGSAVVPSMLSSGTVVGKQSTYNKSSTKDRSANHNQQQSQSPQTTTTTVTTTSATTTPTTTGEQQSETPPQQQQQPPPPEPESQSKQ